MKNLFAVNFAENTIVASKTTLKKASIPNSAEYKALMKLMKQNPTFTISEKVIKEHEGKETYAGLKKDLIEQFIAIQDNAADLDAKYQEASKLGKFPLVRKWFLKEFNNITVKAMKEAIENHNLEQISAVVAKEDSKQPKVIEMSAAANQ